MEAFDITALVIALALNIMTYTLVYIRWRVDCREIGRDRLAVPLRDRIYAAFFVVTLPSALALCVGK